MQFALHNTGSVLMYLSCESQFDTSEKGIGMELQKFKIGGAKMENKECP